MLLRQLTGVVLLTMAMVSCKTSLDALPDAGPTVNGLQLRLRVNTERVRGEYVHEAIVDVMNASSKDVDLKGRIFWDSEDERKLANYHYFLKNQIEFSSYPPTHDVYTSQSTYSGIAYPTYALKAGESIQVKLKGGLGIFNECHFPYNGYYWIRAHLKLGTVSGETIDLMSNCQGVAIGGDRTFPLCVVGRVIAVDDASRTATVDLGAFSGVEKGDVLEAAVRRTDSSLGHWHWKITITDVWTYGARGTLTPENGATEAIKSGCFVHNRPPLRGDYSVKPEGGDK